MSAKVIPLLSEKPIFLPVDGVPYLKLHSASGVYYVRKFKAGKGQLFKTTGETTKGRARIVADEMIAEWLQGKRPTTGRRMRIKEICSVLEEFLKSEAEHGDRRVITSKKDPRMLRVIATLFGDLFADDLDEDWWANWVTFEGRKLGIQLFDHAKYLSKVLTFAHRRKYISRKPQIKNPDAGRKAEPPTMGDAEIAALVDYAVKAKDVALELKAALGYENGFRPGEIEGLRFDMVTFDGMSAIVDLPRWFVKANARIIKVSDRAAKLLRRMEALKTSPYVFPSPLDPSKPMSRKTHAKRWRIACKAAKVPPGRVVKSMRRGFYNRTLLELGLTVQSVALFGGTSIKTLQDKYLNRAPELTESVGQAIQIRTSGKLVKKGRSHGKKSWK